MFSICSSYARENSHCSLTTLCSLKGYINVSEQHTGSIFRAPLSLRWRQCHNTGRRKSHMTSLSVVKHRVSNHFFSVLYKQNCLIHTFQVCPYATYIYIYIYKDLYLTTHNIHNRQAPTSSESYNPAIEQATGSRPTP